MVYGEHCCIQDIFRSNQILTIGAASLDQPPPPIMPLLCPIRGGITPIDALSWIVSQARLSPERRESGQTPIRLLCCILSNRASNDVFRNRRISIKMTLSTQHAKKGNRTCLHLSLSQLRNSWHVRHKMMMGIWPDSLLPAWETVLQD